MIHIPVIGPHDRSYFKTDADYELHQKLPQQRSHNRDEALKVPQHQRLHLFTDGFLIRHPKYGTRFGEAAVGTVAFDAWGRVLGEDGTAVGLMSNNEAELLAIAYAARLAHAVEPLKGQMLHVVHTDSIVAWRALARNQVRKRNLIHRTLQVHREYNMRPDFIVERESASSFGVRRAETLARKALQEKLGEPLTRRASKGRRSNDRTCWNPYDGEAAGYGPR